MDTTDDRVEVATIDFIQVCNYIVNISYEYEYEYFEINNLTP